MERKLAAIFSTDVAGYSRLMGMMKKPPSAPSPRTAVMTTLIQQHRGRVVDSPGDNLLAEFASAVDAVNCAVRSKAIEGQEYRPVGLTQDAVSHWHQRRRCNCRRRAVGDGVNIAARLRALRFPVVFASRHGLRSG